MSDIGRGDHETSADQLGRLRARLRSTPSNASDSASGPDSTRSPGRESAHQQVLAVLDGMDADYTVEGGDVYGRWEQGIFQFSDLGERDAEPVLQVHGTWELVLPEDAYPQAALFCNEWNAVNAWPKAYAQIEEVEHVVGIFGETTVDLTAAPTAEQVELVVSQGIGTALLLFDAAAEAFPDARAIE